MAIKGKFTLCRFFQQNTDFWILKAEGSRDYSGPARVLSGEIGLGEKQDVHAHIFRTHPVYQLLTISRFIRVLSGEIGLGENRY